MSTRKQITLGRFRLDLANECLWQGSQVIALRPKVYALLKYLVDHPDQLVTKEQLLEAVWPGTFVGDAVLKGAIKQLRQVLGDDVESPQYIQTAPRRGYRFVARIEEATTIAPKIDQLRGGAIPADFGDLSASSAPSRQVLGRETELARLQTWLERALAGERQVIFVTGEPGIGKTTLVNLLLDQAATQRGIGIARGQCLEQYGASEAYLPVLDALSRLGRGPRGEQTVEFLRRFAPAWLLELPSLLSPEERASAVGHYPGGATRERMLREIAEAIEAMTTESPLIVVLEDLHWSDYSTLDLIAYLARRSDRARLMVIGTYRPVDVILAEHPLKGVKRELLAHGLCGELQVEYLTEEAVAEYLDVRLPGHRLQKQLARLVHRRTEGNPLFMVNLVDYLLDEGIIGNINGEWQLQRSFVVIESGIPDNVRQLIEKQIDRLSPDERTVLEGASVVGMECSSVAIGAGLERSTEWVDARCEALVQRHHFLSPARLVELPDGTITSRYKFSHVLYLEVPYGLLPPMQRAQIHSRIGTAGEAIYQSRVGEIAAELAMHFEQGHDHFRAVKYLLLAAENARYRSAHHEAEALARRGLRALEMLPPGPQRDEDESGLRLVLGVAVMVMNGFAAADVKDILSPALELSNRQASSFRAFMVQWVLGYFHYFRAELPPCREIAERLSERAGHVGEPLMVIEAHRASGITLLEMGRCQQALEHLDKVNALYEPERYRPRVSLGGWHPLVVSDCFAARALWMMGYPDQALKRMERSVSLARQVAHAESLIVATHFSAHLHQLRGEAAQTQERAETVIAVSEEYGLPLWTALGHMNHGWARIEQGQSTEGLQELRQGISAYESTGARIWKTHFVGLLVQALAKVGQVNEAQNELTKALRSITDTGECWSAAELYRIQGEVLVAQGTDLERPPSAGGLKRVTRISPQVAIQAEESFSQALTIARDQQARSWELKALTSVNRYKLARKKAEDVRRVFKEAYEWFSEGHDTSTLREAHAVLSDFEAAV